MRRLIGKRKRTLWVSEIVVSARNLNRWLIRWRHHALKKTKTSRKPTKNNCKSWKTTWDATSALNNSWNFMRSKFNSSWTTLIRKVLSSCMRVLPRLTALNYGLMRGTARSTNLKRHKGKRLRITKNYSKNWNSWKKNRPSRNWTPKPSWRRWRTSLKTVVVICVLPKNRSNSSKSLIMRPICQKDCQLTWTT